MTTLQIWSSTTCSGHFQGPPESSQTPPKRSLSLLLKIQPWGNSKSARLRSVLGLSGLYPVSSPGNDSATGDVVEANSVAQTYSVTKGAWLETRDALTGGPALQALHPSVSLPLPLTAAVSTNTSPRRRPQGSGHASGSEGSDSGSDNPRSSASRSPSRSRGPSCSSSGNLEGAERDGEGQEQAGEAQGNVTPMGGGMAAEGASERLGSQGQVDTASGTLPVSGVRWQEAKGGGGGGSDAEGSSSLSHADRSHVGVHDGRRTPQVKSDPSADRHMVGGRPPSAPVSPRYIQATTGMSMPVAAAGAASAVALLARLRSGRPPVGPALREPLHPSWLIATRRAALTGPNAKGWIPLPSGILLPFRRPSTSPRTSFAQPDSDDLESLSGLISVTPAPVVPPPNASSPGRDAHGGPTSPRPTSAAAVVRRGGGGGGGSSSSRPNSRHSDQVVGGSGTGMAAMSALAAGDSVAVLTQPSPSVPSPTAQVHGAAGTAAAAAIASVAATAAPLGAASQPSASSTAGGEMESLDRDEAPGASRMQGALQGPLRGSRMQGHVTAVANPAYYAVAAAAAAATAAAVAGYAPPPGLLREIIRRQRLLQPELAIAGESSGLSSVASPVAAAGLTAEASTAGGRGSSLTTVATGGGAFTTSGGGGGGSANSSSSGAAASSAGALRPSLTQHRDVLGATASTVAGAAGAQRWVSPPGTTVVANGVQGHAVALRPSSAYQALGQPAPAGLLPHAQPPSHHLHSHTSGSSWGSIGAISESASFNSQAVATATASSWSGAVATATAAAPVGAAPQPSVVWAATNAALLNQQHRLRQENLGMGQAPTQQRVLLTQASQQQRQAKRGRTRRPSLTEFGNARAQLQYRPTEGWTPGAAAESTPSGKGGVPGGGGAREVPLAASAPCLSIVLQEAADGSTSGGGEAVGVGGGGRQSIMQLPLPPQRPISPGAPGGAAEALAMGMLGPPGALHKRPSSNTRVSHNVSAGGSGGIGSSGGSVGGSAGGAQAAAVATAAVAGGGVSVGGGTAWLSGGVSLLQALAGATDGPPRHHHHHRNHQRHHQNRNQQQQPQQQQNPNANHPPHVQAHHRQSSRHARGMSGAGTAAAAASSMGGASSGGAGAGASSGPAPPFLSMSPGPGRSVNAQRSYGRGGRVH